MATIGNNNFLRRFLPVSLQAIGERQQREVPAVRRSAMRAAIISMVMRSLCAFAAGDEGAVKKAQRPVDLADT